MENEWQNAALFARKHIKSPFAGRMKRRIRKRHAMKAFHDKCVPL
jgi:hypothetical protein